MTPIPGNRAVSPSNLARQNTGRRAGLDEAAGVVLRQAAASIDAPKLLVSVRSQSEITDTLALGVDIVDLKEPRRGALSPADVDLWCYAASVWRQRGHQASPRRISEQGQPQFQPSLSAALGEQSEAVRIAAQLPAEFAFAKVGPSGCDTLRHVSDLWAEVRQLLNDRVELVAVAYADFHPAHCVHPERIFEAAIEAGFRRCLIDTYRKDGVSTVDHLGVGGLRRLSNLAQEAGLWWALAGSVHWQVVTQLWAGGVHPSCFGVRGDVCDRGRTGTLSGDRIQRWKESLASLCPEAAGS